MVKLPKRLFSKRESKAARGAAASPEQPARHRSPPGGAACSGGCESGSAARCEKPQLFASPCRLPTRMPSLAQDENRFVSISVGKCCAPHRHHLAVGDAGEDLHDEAEPSAAASPPLFFGDVEAEINLLCSCLFIAVAVAVQSALDCS